MSVVFAHEEAQQAVYIDGRCFASGPNLTAMDVVKALKDAGYQAESKTVDDNWLCDQDDKFPEMMSEVKFTDE